MSRFKDKSIKNVGMNILSHSMLTWYKYIDNFFIDEVLEEDNAKRETYRYDINKDVT